MGLLDRLVSLRKSPSHEDTASRDGRQVHPKEAVTWAFNDLAVISRALERTPVLLRQQRYDEAEKLLQNALLYNPKDCTVLLSLAHVAHGLKDWPEAERRWQGVISFYPDIHYAHGYHASAILMQGRCSEAIALYLTLVSRFPDDLGPPSQLAYMLDTMSDTEQVVCLSIIDDALLQFRLAHSQSVLALTAHARVAKAQGNWYAVRDRLRLALQIASNDEVIQHDLEEAEQRCQ